jgi:hypothetical protein
MTKLLEIDEKELLTIWLADKVDFASDLVSSTITYWFSDQAIRQPDGHVSGIASGTVSGIASGIVSEPVNYLSEKGLKLVK